MKLKYIGPDPAVTGQVPLPEGWSAVDHEEPDEDLAKEKLEHRVKLGLNARGAQRYGAHTFREWTAADDQEAEEPQAEGEPSAEAEG